MRKHAHTKKRIQNQNESWNIYAFSVHFNGKYFCGFFFVVVVVSLGTWHSKQPKIHSKTAKMWINDFHQQKKSSLLFVVV